MWGDATPESARSQILMVGGNDVGKTSLLTRYADDSFTLITKTTIGIDYNTKAREIGVAHR